jgi:hypothetical protein
VDRCSDLGLADPDWVSDVPRAIDREAIDPTKTDGLSFPASRISSRLKAHCNGEYARWLRETIGCLPLVRPAALQAILDLGAPIITTNYEGLLTKTAAQAGRVLAAVTWRNPDAFLRIIQRDEEGIAHLHGHWQDPASVILDLQKYQELLGDTLVQEGLRALALSHSFVFIGYGEGLADPTFHALRTWMRRMLPDSQHRHFRLTLHTHRQQFQATHPPSERIMAVGYGDHFDDLPEFLHRLIRQRRRR